MSRPLAAALLRRATKAIKFTGPCALSRLPPEAEMPAIVYQIIDINPRDYLFGAEHGYELMRLQINVLASNIDDVQALHNAIGEQITDLAGVTLARARLIHVQRDVVGPESSTTDDAGSVIWTWSRDYFVTYDTAET